MLKYTQCYTRLDLSAYFTYKHTLCLPRCVLNATTDYYFICDKKNNYHRREKIPKTPK